MKTEIKSNNMVIFSDIHLGNSVCTSKPVVIKFLREAIENGSDICINGDVLDIAQVSFNKIAQDVPEVFKVFKTASKRGVRIFYIIGNHDIVLENFLDDWGTFHVVPFLNVESNDSRIRVEHGHIYDPFFVNYPKLYAFATALGGVFLFISPWFYRLWTIFEVRLNNLKKKIKAAKIQENGINGEEPSFLEAANELLQRGFDHVVFGHTHRTGKVEVEEGEILL